MIFRRFAAGGKGQWNHARHAAGVDGGHDRQRIKLAHGGDGRGLEIAKRIPRRPR